MKRTGYLAFAQLLFAWLMPSAFAADLAEWSGAALSAWTNRIHDADATVNGGVMRITCNGSDAHIYSGLFCVEPSACQEVVITAKGIVSGPGELFWMDAGHPATQSKVVPFMWIGDGLWHEYRVRPLWQGECRVARVRIDFPVSAAKGGCFEISSVRIVEGDAQDVICAEYFVGAILNVRSDVPGNGVLEWAQDSRNGKSGRRFTYPEGRNAFYVDLSASPNWKGRVAWTNVTVSSGVVESVELVNAVPRVPPCLVVKSACVGNALNRVGERLPVSVYIENAGTVDTPELTASATVLPSCVSMVKAGCGIVPACGSAKIDLEIVAKSPCSFDAVLEIVGDGIAKRKASVCVDVSPALNLPKSAYVPEPKPVRTKYDIAALYFPGWDKIGAWKRIWDVCPERKPLLGWYDESNSEVVDWQIKWLVENGIGTLYVDWYWNKGHRVYEQWLNAFRKARYRRYLKWAMMWANHNPEGSHSEADQREVTKFWIENCFSMPEYLKIDGKPVVWIWSAQSMERDVGQDGCRRLLDISRKMARDAGYEGIHFIAMKWPESDWSEAAAHTYERFGFDMTGIYHFMDHGGKTQDQSRYAFDLCVEASLPAWRERRAAGVLPFMPSLSTGWDDRPWNNRVEIFGRTPEKFRRICEDAKAFADESGIVRLCLGPINEWGEGSYVEPNAEYGFGFYEAVRDVFCEKPAEGWPLNYGPRDVGLGPYDFTQPAGR